MSLEVQIHALDTHLSIKAVGQYSLASLYGLFDRVKEESEKRAKRRVILDVAEVAGTISVMDMRLLGGHCSKVWKPEFRIAIVSPVGGFDKFFENVVSNRGVQIAVVPNPCTAIEWVNWDQ